MATVGCGKLSVEDASVFAVPGQLAGDVEHPGDSQGSQRGRVLGVPGVAQVEERQHPGGWVRVYVRRRG